MNWCIIVQMVMAKLPQDVIVEILLWASAKSLARFRCVSKPWLSLISNPYFCKSHSKRASTLNTHKILLSTPTNLQSFDYDGDGDDDDDDDSVLVSLNFPLKRPDSSVKILGSCHGLICIALDDLRNLFIWNPLTGDYKNLPDPDGSNYIYGFGYDSSSDDYKIVVATYSSCFDVKIFTMRTNSWTSVQDPYQIPHWINGSLGTLLNGAVHWVAKQEFYVIIAFDLAEEIFKEVPLPDFVENVFIQNLGVLGGCLCVFCCAIIEEEYCSIDTLWVMKEYGVKESWTMLYKISKVRGIGYVHPLCFTKRGDIVMLNNGKELIKFGRRDKCDYKRYRLGCDRNECEATVYMESLLSPNALNEIE